MDKKIEYTHVESVFNFIRKSLGELEDNNFYRDNIKIMMPNYFKRILQEYYNNTMSSSTECSSILRLEILPHYKNEVVVFYENYFNSDNHYKVLNLEI